MAKAIWWSWLSDEDANILKEELKLAGCSGIPQINFGITMLGPVILEYGTEEQRQEFLPKISKGEIRWCQGFLSQVQMRSGRYFHTSTKRWK